MSEDFGHRRFVFDLCAISVVTVLLIGALFLFGTVVLLILGAWLAVGVALGFLIGPLFEDDKREK